MKTRSLLRTCIILATALVITSEVEAQTNSYTAHVQEVEVDSSPKALFTAVADLIPDAEMEHDRSSGTLLIATNLLVTHQELETVIVPAGYYLISFVQN